MIYIDAGFLDGSVRVDDLPKNNPQYPDTWATTYFPVQLNDVINCEELRSYNADGRIRFYQSNGVQGMYVNAGIVNIRVSDKEFKNARLMMLNAKAPIPKELTVTHTDGTIDIYKIIDRR